VIFQRGEIWLVQFSDLPEGGEQGFKRPAVVVSSDGINDLPLDVVTVIPCTSRRRENNKTRKVPANLVEVSPSSINGLTEVSYFMCEQVRSVSKSVRMKRKLGAMDADDMKRLEQALCLVLHLFP